MGFAAKILADSLAPSGARLTTFEVTYPRCIHSEFMTHRLISRNAASSRAIPVEKLIERVVNDPFVPIEWGKNQKGMQAGEALSGAAQIRAGAVWLNQRDRAVEAARELLDLGLHKQLTNRILEPWMWITVIASATNWTNFFGLRCHKDAEPHFQKIAGMMREAYEASKPRKMGLGEWHLPLWGFDGDAEEALKIVADDKVLSVVADYGLPFAVVGFVRGAPAIIARKVSVGRCARVSYLTHDGRRDLKEDIALHDRLMNANPGHWCYDAQTEVLTSRGWRRWPEVVAGDLLAAVDPVSRAIRFAVVSEHQMKTTAFSGEMYSVRGQQIDLLVTPNHRMVVSSRQSGGGWTPFEFVKAGDLGQRSVRYLKAGFLIVRSTWKNPWGVDPVVWARFVGFFVGDGNAEGGNQAKFNVRLERKENYVRALGLPWRKVSNGFVVELPGLGNWLRDNCYTQAGEKQLPLCLCVTHCKRFCTSMDWRAASAS